jgi:hypothetical protein
MPVLDQLKTRTAWHSSESIPTLSRTLNVYEWPLEQVQASRRQLIREALQHHCNHSRDPSLLST